MPKRSTHTYSSEDAPETDDAKISVYYCRSTGEHVLITDADLSRLPKRRTDGARVLDTEKHTVRLKATPEPKAVLIRREGGALEKQYRYVCGALPVCYKSEQEGRYLYIIDGALSAFNYGQAEDGAAPGADGVDGGVAPVPPCIQHTSTGTVRVAVELDDRARARAVTKITADEVGVSLQTRANVAQDELLEFMGKVLRLRLPQMSLVRGWSTRSKLLMVQGLTAREVYDRLRAAMEEHRAKISRLASAHGGDGGLTRRPEVEKLEKLEKIDARMDPETK